MGKQKNKITLLVLLVLSILAVSLFFQNKPILAQENNDEAIKDNIDEVQQKLQKEQQAKNKLLQDLNQIQTSVNKAQYEISKTQSYIQETQENISRKEAEIALLDEKIELQRKLLASFLREMYYSQSEPAELAAIKTEGFSQFLGGEDHMSAIEKKITSLIGEIKSSKTEIEKGKKELEDNREEHERLLDLKQDQRQTLLSEKYETQQDVQEKEATIAELQAKLSKLQRELSGLLGKSYNAKDIEDAAKFASKVSGVRKDFILGMLVVESDLGRFTGGCYAKDSKMSGIRLSLFKDICEELDYNWKTRKVSCPPKGYKGTGGAMGVAQFMPDTWMGYKSQIASVTGHNPPDPWNLTDGVTGMGLKLARGGATNKSKPCVSKSNGECKAAMLYLSGTTDYGRYKWYCEKACYWADNYERLLN